MASMLIVLSLRYGPSGVGFMSYFKSLIDLGTNLVMVGMPSGIIYTLNNKQASAGTAAWFNAGYFAILLAGAIVVGQLAGRIGFTEFSRLTEVEVTLLGLAVAGLTLNWLNRSISLVVQPVWIFNLNTAVPAFTALLIVLIWIPEDYRALAAAWTIAGAVALIVSTAMLARAFGSGPPPAHDLRRFVAAVKNFSRFTYAHVVLLTGATAATYWYLNRIDPTATLNGYFGVGVLALTALITPANMISPVLFDWWAKADNAPDGSSFTYLSHGTTIVGLLILAAVIVAVGPLIELIFGPAFRPAILPTQILCGGAVFFIKTRVLVATAFSMGSPQGAAAASLIRLGVIIVPLVLGWRPGLPMLAGLWVIAEFASVTSLALFVAHTGRWPLVRVLGISPGGLRDTFSYGFRLVRHQTVKRGRQ